EAVFRFQPIQQPHLGLGHVGENLVQKLRLVIQVVHQLFQSPQVDKLDKQALDQHHIGKNKVNPHKTVHRLIVKGLQLPDALGVGDEVHLVLQQPTDIFRVVQVV